MTPGELRSGRDPKMEHLLHHHAPENGPPIIHVAFASKQTIFLEGDHFGTVEILSQGFARLYKVSICGRRQIIGFALPGDILEMPFSARHTLSADAIGSVSAYRFLKHRFVRNLQCSPDLLFGMLEFATLELSAARSQIVLLGSLSAEEKLIEFLIDWRNRLARVSPLSNILPLPMNRSDIAECIGVRLETVCRALAKLERENVLRVVPKGLQLLGARQLPLLLQRRYKRD